MNHREEVWKAALAGLLHDIGKFAQRAGERGSLEARSAIEQYGRYHAMLTNDFLKEVLPFGDEVRLAAANHHLPQTHLDWVVKVADILAAGERADPPQGEDSSEAQPRQLLSIFCVVNADNVCWKDQKDKWRFLPLKSLALQETVIFAGDALDDKAVWGIYKNQWDKFKTEVQALKQLDDLETYLEAVLALLQRFGWCIPAAYYRSRPDISLYDHSRMTAALATCLAELDETTLRQIAEDPANSQLEVALLLGGDISGVQDFIYTIPSKGAAKMLRGRSLYLQLLTEAVLRFVLRRLDLPYTNVIYAGGGHFFLLAPLSARDKITQIQAEVGNLLIGQHGTQLHLVMGHVAIPASGFQIGKLSLHWQAMQDQLTLAKNRRYAELGGNLHPFVFEVAPYGGNPDEACSVCGDDSRGAMDWDEWEGQQKICPLCRSFAETLGKVLPEARFLALKFSEPPPIGASKANTALDILALFGMQIQFLKQANEAVGAEGKQNVVLWALDDPQQGIWPSVPKPTPRYLRYTANRVPPFTFDELQKKTESGFERLGVLRMDVDNLGRLFKEGLGESFSLSRMATLSFQISLFFEGWLKRIVEHAQWHDLVYTVYSGGDDLFLIAPWDKVPSLAQKIVADFAAYTAHPGLHISGGLAFIDGKYPIYQAAEDAAEAEELAKTSGKNAFGFLGRAWRWDEFQMLSHQKDELKALVQGGDESEQSGPKSLLQTLRSLALMEEEAIAQSGRPVWGRWQWLGAYQLVRMASRYDNKRDLKDKITKLHQQLGDFRNLSTWGAAARWAQLETRKRKDG